MINNDDLLKIKKDIKNMSIRNLKVFHNVVALVMPIVLGTLGFNYLMEKTNSNPITVDKVKYYQHTMNYFNSDGDEVENITYGTNNGQNSELVVTNKWEESEKGEYVQKKETYKIKANIDFDTIYEIVTNKDEIRLKPILGNPVGTELAVKQDITKEERLKPSIYEATINRDSKEEYVYGPESESRNLATSFFWICTELALTISYSTSKYAAKRIENAGKAITEYNNNKKEEQDNELDNSKKL